MKRWLGLILVGLFLGTLWLGAFVGDSEATNPSYTIYVNVIYDDTQQPASNIEVKLEDTTTGSSCSKWTNSGGQVSFDPTVDLASYSDGDELKLYLPDTPSSYDSGIMIIIGDNVWDNEVFTLHLWPKQGSQSYTVGYMNLVDGTTKFTLNTPQTIYKSHPLEVVYFTATGATSMSSAPSGYTNAAYVSVTYRLYMYRYNSDNTVSQVGSDQYSTNVNIPGKSNPVQLTVSTSFTGDFYFVLRIEFRYFDQNNVPIGGQHTGSKTTLYWHIKLG